MMTSDIAQVLALKSAAWIASDGDMLSHFLAASGMAADDFRDSLGQPEVLAALIDFICLDDAWVLACAQACGFAPEEMTTLRQLLPGGEQTHWT